MNKIFSLNILKNINKLIRENLKIIIILIVLLFLSFLIYQTYSYYKQSIIKKDSITYFNLKELDDKIKINEIMLSLSKKNNFYSLLATLDLIDENIQNQNYNELKTLYLNILNNFNLDNVYVSAIASHAAYNFINIQNDNLNLNFIEDTNEFISYIDEDQKSYKEIKYELQYLNLVTEYEKNNISYHSSTAVIDLYNLIMTSENISSNIKERVNKIHEYQLYN